MSDVEIRPVAVPTAVDAPEAWAVRGAVDAETAASLHDIGDADYVPTALQVVVSLNTTTYYEKDWFVAVRPGTPEIATPDDVLGAASAQYPVKDNQHLAFIGVFVRPEHRRQGIGAALYDAALATVREHGRRTVMVTTDHTAEEPTDPAARLVPSTGTGVVPRTDSTRFALARGFSLEQVSRRSRQELPVPDDVLTPLQRQADAAVGDAYRLVQWRDDTPERWIDDFALMETRMSTDTPMGGLEFTEDAWDAARVLDYEKNHRRRGQGYWLTAAQHVETGRLAAFTMLMRTDGKPGIAHQEDTLVLKEHRGHRLGLWVKLANLAYLQSEADGISRVGTWNAEENSYMLAINVAMGYRPAGASGEWQLKL
ncbi:GCN5-related protein N-acetyltransferase [Beutenbergia cavernae DSM 12333]|uniref:GCN5-related protein N-acetyltransferase n=1 Tax=Beutenbergia cavernae (strain ATCC BAA-8 / DSM 12333 / CCUG 43141 / JCM 11478 / NBRC 16432 / NCIMB 13614 / HKI 0122) TaxID=471853 RepID=C5C4A3_BEUC1|nr:GNAT family N-acetyltransferase [Beutenbergia cavernae]ACQ82027.1 GCN5-related protein N-acetyltransferase [Beutenbergia cavernae DSM 12333]